MKFLVLEVVMPGGPPSRQHIVTAVGFGPGGVVVDVDHRTGDDHALRTGTSRYTTPASSIDWAGGNPMDAATEWLASDAGPLSGAEVHEVEEVEAARLSKEAEVRAAHAAAVIAAGSAADEALRRVADAVELSEVEAVDPAGIAAAAGGTAGG